MPTRNRLGFVLLILWASPWSLCGLLVGTLGLLSGGGCQRRDRILEFYGGWIRTLLRRVPIAGGASAITLGHTVIGCTSADLDRVRPHELVHVGQYERWGPLFVPAYLLSSVYLALRGYDPYLDNPFEKEAFDFTSIDRLGTIESDEAC